MEYRGFTTFEESSITSMEVEEIHTAKPVLLTAEAINRVVGQRSLCVMKHQISYITATPLDANTSQSSPAA